MTTKVELERSIKRPMQTMKARDGGSLQQEGVSIWRSRDVDRLEMTVEDLLTQNECWR